MRAIVLLLVTLLLVVSASYGMRNEPFSHRDRDEPELPEITDELVPSPTPKPRLPGVVPATAQLKPPQKLDPRSRTPSPQPPPPHSQSPQPPASPSRPARPKPVRPASPSKPNKPRG